MYRYPIYALPPQQRLRHASRQAIDFGHALAGSGLALFYARDRFDLYVLQIEGGGKIRIHGHGRTRTAYLSYAGDNGRALVPLEDYMEAHGMLSGDDRSRHAQRRYLQRHPGAARRVYSSCPYYVFFRVTREPPLGSAGVPLTPGRSLASDPRYYPLKGLIAFVQAQVPVLPAGSLPLDSNPDHLRHRWLQQFFVDQDEGPEIRGPGRFDLYFGESRQAKFLANNFLRSGTVYLLVAREQVSPAPRSAGAAWIMAQDPEAYTAQLEAAYHASTLALAIRRFELGDGAVRYHVRYKRRELHVLIYGRYDTRAQAQRAVRGLPEELRRAHPWIRRFKAIQDELRQGKQ